MKRPTLLEVIALVITGAALIFSVVTYSHAKKSAENLGVSFNIPSSVAFFSTSLQNSITSSATSFTLVANTDKAGTALASSTYAFVIDEGTASEEILLADCFVAGAKTCSNASRGISVVTGTSTVSALQKSHRRGATVQITDAPILLYLNNAFKGTQNIEHLLRYNTSTACNSSSPTTAICDRQYIVNLANSGAATSTETNGGIVELATALEQASSTDGGASKPLVLQAKNATSSPNGTAAALYALILNNAGKIAQTALNLAASFTWTGAHTYTGDNTYNGGGTATSTFNRGVDIDADADSPFIIRGISYVFPSSDGSDGQALKTNGSGTLAWKSEGNQILYSTNGRKTGAGTLLTGVIPAGTFTSLTGKLRITWEGTSSATNCSDGTVDLNVGNGSSSTTIERLRNAGFGYNVVMGYATSTNNILWRVSSTSAATSESHTVPTYYAHANVMYISASSSLSGCYVDGLVVELLTY